MTRTYNDFFENLASRESSNYKVTSSNDPTGEPIGTFIDQYHNVNTLGYLGKYQFTKSTLVGIGFYQKADGETNSGPYIGTWSEASGISGQTGSQAYLDSSNTQESAVRTLASMNWQEIQNLNLQRYIGETFTYNGNMEVVTESGMLMA